MAYYFKQIDRKTGDFLCLISYDNTQPTNDHPDILLEEITKEEFEEGIASGFENPEESEEGAEPNGE